MQGSKLVAQCPAHDDNNPSLSIAYIDGKVLLTCFAGCQLIDIVTSLNLTVNDLFDDNQNLDTNVVDLARYRLNLEHPAVTTPTTPPQTPETTEWVYTDENYQPLIKTVKTRLPDGKKTFRQYHYNGTDWIIGLGNTTPVLYNLPQVILNAQHGGITVICEGEKDADTYNQHNTNPDIWATTAPMGAGKWRDDYTQTLQGTHEIWIIPDNDKPGLDHATKIINALTEANIPWRLKTVNPKVKDLTDHINNGATLADLIDNNQLADKARNEHNANQLAKAIDEERIRQQAREQVRKELAETNAAGRYQLPASRNLKDELALPDEPIAYIIENLWPTGANISLTATYKAGKTSTINNIIKALADGEYLFGHYQSQHEGNIAYWNYEVSPNQIRTWLREVTINNTHLVHLLNMRGHTWPISSQYVIDQTIQWLKDRTITTWIIDPLARAFVNSGDENSNQDVGIFLDTLDYIKDQAGVANLLIAAHTGRNAEQGNSRARGASRFDDWVDARWMISKTDDGNRYFAADGRDVQQDEALLEWDAETRRQTIKLGTQRQDAKKVDDIELIKQLLTEHKDGLTCYKMATLGVSGIRDKEPKWFQKLHTGNDTILWKIGISDKGTPIYALKK